MSASIEQLICSVFSWLFSARYRCSFFRNDSGHERRLTADLGPIPEADLEAETEAEESEGHGDESHGAKSDHLLACTTLVEEGGAQLMTLQIDVPSAAVEGGYQFRVPGTDASLEVIVP